MQITAKQYKSKPETYWLGRKVRILKTIQNGWARWPSGTTAIITRKYRGFSLESDACDKCGVKVLISTVEPYCLEDITPDLLTPPPKG